MASLGALFEAMLGNNNAARGQAEACYSQLKVSAPSQVILELVATMKSSTIESHRALSAVLLRGITLREMGLWKSLSSEQFAHCRSEMLLSLTNEPVHFIQRKIVDSVAIHAKIGEWPELLHAVVAMQTSSDMKWVILSLQLLEKLAEYVGKFIVSNYAATISIIEGGLNINSVNTKCAAYLALFSIAFEVSEMDSILIKHFTAFPATFSEIFATDEDLIVELVAVLNRLVGDRPQFFASCALPLIDALLVVVGNNDTDDTVRVAVLEVITGLFTKPALVKHTRNPQYHQRFITLLVQLMALVDDDDGGIGLLSKPESGQGFGDMDADGDDNLPEFASMCLSNVAEAFPAEEVMQICMSIAGSMIQQTDWRARRAALFLVGLVADPVREALEQHVPMLLDTSIRMFSDPHPRVRFSALHCMSVLVEVFESKDDDDDDEDDNTDGSTQHGLAAFKSDIYQILPQQVFTTIQGNLEYPRISYMGICTLKLLFDPDTCPKEMVQDLSGGVLDVCMQLLASPTIPLFVNEEVASLMGNVSLLTPTDALFCRYPGMISILWSILRFQSAYPDAWWVSQTEDQGIRLLKCKTLECFALVGKAIGLEAFRDEARAILDSLVRAQQQGLDFSDPLASYIMQTCVRIAGILGNEFQPYINIVLPIVLNKVTEEISVEIVENDGIAPGAASAAADGSVSSQPGTFNFYKRGIGNVQIVCDSAQVTDKEMACRVLFQYCLDTPMLILPHAATVVGAVVPNIDSAQLSETLAIICGSILSEIVKCLINFSGSYLRGSAADLQLGNISQLCIVSLVAGLEKSMQIRDSQAAAAIFSQLIDSLRELLRHLWDGNHVLQLPLCPLADELMMPMVVVLRDASAMKIKQITEIEDESELAEVEESFDALIDCLCWVIKLFADRLASIFVAELLPLCQGILSSSNCPIPLVSFALCCIVDALDTMPQSLNIGVSTLCAILMKYLQEPDLAVICAYGIGVCAMKGDESMNEITATAIGVVGRELAILAPKVDMQSQCIRDNLLSSLFKFCVYRSQFVGHTQLINLACMSMPLSNDLFEARALHALAIQLLSDVLVGKGPNSLSIEECKQILAVVAKLASSEFQDLDLNPALGANLTYWNDQNLYPHSLHFARQVLNKWFAASSLSGLPPQRDGVSLDIGFVNRVLSEQPAEIKSLFSVIINK